MLRQSLKFAFGWAGGDDAPEPGAVDPLEPPADPGRAVVVPVPWRVDVQALTVAVTAIAAITVAASRRAGNRWRRVTVMTLLG